MIRFVPTIAKDPIYSFQPICSRELHNEQAELHNEQAPKSPCTCLLRHSNAKHQNVVEQYLVEAKRAKGLNEIVPNLEQIVAME